MRRQLYGCRRVRLHCWTRGSHGTQTIRQAIGNSCNPALAKVATLMGKQTFYKYLGLYGITEKTGVDYPGEAGSIMYALKDVGPVELATIGYGLSISVTPMQLLNDGQRHRQRRGTAAAALC